MTIQSATGVTVLVTNPESPFGGVTIEFPGGTQISFQGTQAGAGSGNGSGGAGGSSESVPPTTETTFYMGVKARWVPLSNGLRLEVQNSSLNWIPQQEWTEP